MSPVVSITVRAAPEAAFDGIVQIDLPSILRGYGPLPAVTGTGERMGAWNTIGQTRRVLLSDGSQARETLTDLDRPAYYAYDITGALKLLASGARGERRAEPEPQGYAGATPSGRVRGSRGPDSWCSGRCGSGTCSPRCAQCETRWRRRRPRVDSPEASGATQRHTK